MTQRVLVIFDGNWADEMNIKGFKLTDKESWEKYVESLPEKGKFTAYVGSNQDMEFTGRKDYLYNIKVVELSEEEYNLLKRLFPWDFGKFVEPDVDEEEDND